MHVTSETARRSWCAPRSLMWIALTGGLVLCQSEFAGAQCNGGAGGGGGAGGTGVAAGGINVDALQAQQFMLQMQQLQAEAMRQQAVQMMLAAQRHQAQGERAQQHCTQRTDNVAGSIERVAAIRDTGDRFASQRANARVRQEAIAVRIANRESELQRRRDRAAAGR